MSLASVQRVLVTVALAQPLASRLAKASNLSDIPDKAAARANLGLGDAATKATGTTAGTVAAGDDSRIVGAAQKSANLSDLASAATARTNLGLGDSSTKNTGTGAGTVAAGDDSRITGSLQRSGGTMTGDIAMGGQKVTGLGAPSGANDAARKADVDVKVAKAGDTMSGNLAMGGHKVTGIGAPSSSGDAATKGYTDTADTALSDRLDPFEATFDTSDPDEVVLTRDMRVGDSENRYTGLIGEDGVNLPIGVDKVSGETRLLLDQEAVTAATRLKQLGIFAADENGWIGILGENEADLPVAWDPLTGRARLHPDRESMEWGFAALTGRTVPLYMPQRLRQTREKLGRLRQGSGGQFAGSGIGDSWTGGGGTYINAVTASLQGLFGNAGHGWFGVNQSDGNAAGYTRTESGTWTTEGWPSGASPNGWVRQSTIAEDTMSFVTAGGDTAASLFVRDGEMRYRINGGSWTTIDATGDAGDLQSFALTGVPGAGAWTVEVEVVSGTVKIAGLYLSRASAGVRINNLGSGGTTSRNFVDIAEQAFTFGVQALAGDLHWIFHGTNDQYLNGASITPQHHYDNLTTLVARIRSVLPATDILLITSPEVREPQTTGPAMSLYSDAARQVAIEQKCTHLDLQAAFGEAFDDYKFGSARPYMENGVHPVSRGQYALREAFLRTLLYS